MLRGTARGILPASGDGLGLRCHIQQGIVSAIGVAVALLVAVAEAILGYFTGYHIFGFSVFLIVPAGSILVGLAAASGYYFACKSLQLRPNILLLAQMIIVAAVTNLLIYFLGFLALLWGDPRAFDLGLFATYLGEYITGQTMAVGRSQLSKGQVGGYGYLLAVLDFVGFLIGGGIMVFMLLRATTCKECNLYYKTRGKRNRLFHSVWDAAKYYDGLFALPIDGPEFAAKASLGVSRTPYGPGAVQIKTTLLSCPSCEGQAWHDQGSEWTGQSWRTLDRVNRLVVLPKGADLTDVLKRESVKAEKPPETDRQPVESQA